MDNSTIFLKNSSFDGASLPIFKNKLSLDKDNNYVIWMCQFPNFGSPSGLGWTSTYTETMVKAKGNLNCF